MHDSRPRWWVRLIVKVRRLIETVIGQLVGRFHLDKVWARDIWHLSSRLNRKILAHTNLHYSRKGKDERNSNKNRSLN
jgi:hypothetical protein